MDTRGFVDRIFRMKAKTIIYAVSMLFAVSLLADIKPQLSFDIKSSHGYKFQDFPPTNKPLIVSKSGIWTVKLEYKDEQTPPKVALFRVSPDMNKSEKFYPAAATYKHSSADNLCELSDGNIAFTVTTENSTHIHIFNPLDKSVKSIDIKESNRVCKLRSLSGGRFMLSVGGSKTYAKIFAENGTLLRTQTFNLTDAEAKKFTNGYYISDIAELENGNIAVSLNAVYLPPRIRDKEGAWTAKILSSLISCKICELDADLNLVKESGWFDNSNIGIVSFKSSIVSAMSAREMLSRNLKISAVKLSEGFSKSEIFESAEIGKGSFLNAAFAKLGDAYYLYLPTLLDKSAVYSWNAEGKLAALKIEKPQELIPYGCGFFGNSLYLAVFDCNSRDKNEIKILKFRLRD